MRFGGDMSYPLRLAANALCVALPGFNYHAAVCWVQAEQGLNNNFLGLEAPGGKLLKFASLMDAATAYASVICANKQYAGIIAVLKDDDILVQLKAVARSGWRTGHAGIVDVYYARVFASLGYNVS